MRHLVHSARTRITLLATAAILTACATAQENPNYQYSTKYKGDSPITSQGVTSQGTSYASSTVPGTISNTRQVVFEGSPQSGNFETAGYATTTYASPTYSRVDASCIEQGTQNTVACPVMSVPVTQQNAALVATPYTGGAQTLYVTDRTTTYTATSPTESVMPESYGTPGYEAMKNAESEWSFEATQTPDWQTVQSSPAQTPSAAAGLSVPVTEPFASALPAPEFRQHSHGAPSVQQVRTPDMMPRNEQVFARGTSHEIVEGDTVYSFARKLCSSVDEIKTMNSLDGTFNIRLGETIRLPASKC